MCKNFIHDAKIAILQNFNLKKICKLNSVFQVKQTERFTSFKAINLRTYIVMKNF